MSICLHTLAPAPARTRTLHAVPTSLIAALAWVAACLIARELSVNAFLWLTGLGLTWAVARPFVDGIKRGIDAGDALPMFTLYYLLAMLLRGIGLLTFVDSPYLRELGDKDTELYRVLVGWAFFYSAIGMMAAYAAYHSAFARRWEHALPARLPLFTAPWSRRRLPFTVGVLVCVGIAAATTRVHGPAGFLTAAANPMKMGTEEAVGFWWLIALTEFAVVGFHVFMISLLLRRDPRFLMFYIVFGLGLSAPLYLVSSSKFLILRVLFLPWLFRHFLVQRIPIWKIMAAFATFGALFPFFYAYRALGIMRLDMVSRYLEQIDNPLMPLFNRSYGTDSFMLILYRSGVTVPLQWGHSLLDIFTFWIPRLLWPAKPISFGLTFPATYMPDMHWGNMTYASCSLPGELYLNFHFAGVLAGCAVLGLVMRVALGLARSGPGGLLLYGYVFLTAMHLVEGIIASQVETMIMHTVPTLLALWWLTRTTRGRAAAGTVAS